MNFEEYEKQEKERIRKNLFFAEKGVRFIDIKQVYIEGNKVDIKKGTVLYPGVILEGSVTIGEDCVIGPGTRITESEIGDRTQIQNSVITESRIGTETKIGPFAYLRPGSDVGSGCRIGDFVEIKNSVFGDGSKASHLSYIGDSDIGKDVNIGCGVVFVNYDGSKKYRSKVGDGTFIGCNVNLVSPVTLEEGSYIAAGSTVTKDVPGGALYVERSKGRVLEGWVEKRGILKK
ncbi:MAG TPA: DapH/DapD/GlmU-related protein [Bacillota bacterium]|nr:DapH/DapD/GlmU-related protein [Bacillota bacterium]HUM56619.1 DapH/DapD/GlmU-related protein [Bacillota bacterium]